jgi:hypothetical protein
MMDIIGATSTAAEAALMRSAPSRRARFLVFHFAVVLLPELGSFGAGTGRDDPDAALANSEGLTGSNLS